MPSATPSDVVRLAESSAPRWHRRLLDLMSDGFCVIEVILDADDRVVDARYHETNPAFSRLVGTVDPDGRLASELFPEFEAYWLERLERVHRSGEPEAYIDRSEALGVWYESSLTRIDGHGGRLLTCLFRDVSERVLQARALEGALERVSLATESGNASVWELDLRRRTVLWTPQMYRLFGLPAGARETDPAAALKRVHVDDREPVRRALRAAIRRAGEIDVEFRVARPDGEVVHLQASARLSRDERGRATRLLGLLRDVTGIRSLGNELAEQRELLQVTLQSIADAVITSDALGRVTWMNPAAERVTGWSTAEAAGRPVARVFATLDEETGLPTPDPAAACLERGALAGLVQHRVLVRRDGGELAIEESVAPIRNDAGELLGTVLVFHDVSERRRLVREMTHRAAHDALTGLVNRQEFEVRLLRSLLKARAERGRNALMYIDLDQFKRVNDSCGHSVGDELLRRVSELLRRVVRDGDTLARIGGDEFAVILQRCTGEQARRAGQAICDSMDEFRFEHAGQRYRVGASIGIVPLDERWFDIAAVMQAADASCYAAKEAGRNRVHLWFDTDRELRARSREARWATRLEAALEGDRFELHAQRIDAVDVAVEAAGAATGADVDAVASADADADADAAVPSGVRAEVLVRLRDERGRLVMPAAFLPAAERFYLVTRIDRRVLGRVVGLLSSPAGTAGVRMLSVNLSGHSITDRMFCREALELLTAAGPDVCRRLCFEVAETAAVATIIDTTRFTEEMRSLGVRVSLDDFGAGASSFGYLKSLSADELKIDGQFVQDLLDDPLADVAVRCFVDLARVVGVRTVAEHVECPEVLARLREMGVDFVQGFLLHRPEPIDSLLASASASVQERARASTAR